jgi:hypothetical protein
MHRSSSHLSAAQHTATHAPKQHHIKASFLEFAPAYFQHMARAAVSGEPTTLAKVVGVFSVGFRGQVWR